MVALRNGSKHEECLACWRELVLLDGLGDVKLDERTYNLALGSAVKAERWEEVEAIFDMMEVSGNVYKVYPSKHANVCSIRLLDVFEGPIHGRQ